MTDGFLGYERADGSFGQPVLSMPMAHGHELAIGDVDGNGTPDIYAVDGCANRINRPDLLLLNGGNGRDWTQVGLPPLPPGPLAGCGDTAAMLDVDGDGRQDVVVSNGRWSAEGPIQVLTAGPWRG